MCVRARAFFVVVVCVCVCVRARMCRDEPKEQIRDHKRKGTCETECQQWSCEKCNKRSVFRLLLKEEKVAECLTLTKEQSTVHRFLPLFPFTLTVHIQTITSVLMGNFSLWWVHSC